MEASMLAWLERMGSSVLFWSVAALLLIDAVAITAVVITRDRTLVNRWTGLVLAANLMLLGVGASGQAVAFVGKMAVTTVASLLPQQAALSNDR
jgi:hypothetical protein